jgi:hypothetical protein
LISTLLFSCTNGPFDHEASFADNDVKVIIERSYSFENKNRVLVLESFSYLKNNGKADSVITNIYPGNRISESRRYFHYNFSGVLDSIQIISYQDTSLFIHTEMHHLGLFGNVDSISFYITFNKKRMLDLRKTFSYAKNGRQKTETFISFPQREIRRKEITSFDENGKIIYTNKISHGERKIEIESYDYQYDNVGKIISSKHKINGNLNVIHTYEYLSNDLRKTFSVIRPNGDSVYLHLYSYKYRK